MADWEAGFLISELNSGRYLKKKVEEYNVQTFSIIKNPIVTMGGIRIIPDFSLDEIIPDTTDLIILTGGETWMENLHDPLMDKVKTWLNEGILIASICGATIALANSGILDNRSHTSNNLEYLKTMCPNYIR